MRNAQVWLSSGYFERRYPGETEGRVQGLGGGVGRGGEEVDTVCSRPQVINTPENQASAY